MAVCLIALAGCYQDIISVSVAAITDNTHPTLALVRPAAITGSFGHIPGQMINSDKMRNMLSIQQSRILHNPAVDKQIHISIPFLVTAHAFKVRNFN